MASDDDLDLYQILGVSKNSSNNDIKKVSLEWCGVSSRLCRSQYQNYFFGFITAQCAICTHRI